MTSVIMMYILLALFAVVISNVSAYIIDTPQINQSNEINPTRPVRTHPLFRIRHTRATDLDVISTMLATEAVPFTHTHNWNHDMKRLRAKSEFTRQLTHRLAALDEGRLAASRLKQNKQYTSLSDDDNDDEICSLSDPDYDTCYQLWQISNFRSKVQTAVKHSQENNAWKVHNFELTPSAELFNHVMLSVVHTLSGDIVGFCELAWLSCPQPNLIEVTTQQSYAPAIVNLVTSSNHRRKGIASRLLKFASKYTTTQWKRTQYDNDSTRLGLYVQLENESALRLYRKEGFTQISNSDVDGLIYMRQK
jgi:ribosomal protein S18 acetylase RimI-like enzyme